MADLLAHEFRKTAPHILLNERPNGIGQDFPLRMTAQLWVVEDLFKCASEDLRDLLFGGINYQCIWNKETQAAQWFVTFPNPTVFAYPSAMTELEKLLYELSSVRDLMIMADTHDGGIRTCRMRHSLHSPIVEWGDLI